MLENNFFTKRVVQALEQAAQCSGGVPNPGGIEKPCRCGTWGRGLEVALAVLGS